MCIRDSCKHGRIIGQAAMVRRSRTSWTCSWNGHSGTLQRHWHWVDCRRAAIVRFWVADRSDSWSVPAFGAKWIISGRQAVRCGRPACTTNAYSWHNLQLVHRLGDYRGTPIINLRFVLVFGAKWSSAGSIRVAGATMHLWGKICNFALVDNITGPQQTYLCIG